MGSSLQVVSLKQGASLHASRIRMALRACERQEVTNFIFTGFCNLARSSRTGSSCVCTSRTVAKNAPLFHFEGTNFEHSSTPPQFYSINCSITRIHISFYVEVHDTSCTGSRYKSRCFPLTPVSSRGRGTCSVICVQGRL